MLYFSKNLSRRSNDVSGCEHEWVLGCGQEVEGGGGTPPPSD